MIDILPAPDHVVALRLSGRIDGDDLGRCIAVIDATLERHPRIGVFADAMAFEGMTAEAFLKDLRYGFSKLGELNRFARVAVVAGEGWVRTIARFENRLFPRIDIRVFDDGQQEQALAWAAV